MKTVGLEEARGLLARAVLTQGPDFIYNPDTKLPTCQYVKVKPSDLERCTIEGIMVFDNPRDHPATKTGCLIGVALGLLGANVAGLPNEAIGGKDVNYVLGEMMGIKLTMQTRAYFTDAQFHQDQGNSWGSAYAFAEGRVETIKKDFTG